jgi:hypothetical protein
MRWWESKERSREYMERLWSKWSRIRERDPELAWEIYHLPRDFLCFQSRGMKGVEEFHRVLATAVARPPGAWEYVTLEVERATMRWATRCLRLRRLAERAGG